MRSTTTTSTRFVLGLVAAVALGCVTACGEYSVPITDQPTQKVDRQLIGDWVTPDGIDSIKVRQLTDSTYVVCYSGLLFRAFHSDLAKVHFLSVQELETDNRTYSYVSYRMSADGNKIYLRMVNDEVISDESNDPLVIQKLLIKNLQHPSLFNSEEEFRRAS